MPANDFLAYLTQRQRPSFNAGSAPALMSAPTAPYENPGALFAGAFQQAYQSGVDNRFRQAELDRQDAALAQQQQEIDNAREILFDEVAAGTVDPRTLQQFDVAPGEAKLAIAQQALAGPEQLDPKTAAELELEYAKLAQDQNQFGATQGLEQRQFEAELGLDRERLGLDRDTLEQEKELALAEANTAADRAAIEDQFKQQELAIKAEGNLPDDVLALMATGDEVNLENLERVAESRANRTKNITGEQRKAASFHTRARSAQDAIGALEAGGYSPAAGMEQLRGMGGRLTMSDDAKAYNDHKNEFIRVILRKESGAALTQQDFDLTADLFPELGDGPADIARKAQQRETILQGLEAEGANAIDERQAPAGKFDRTSSSGTKYRVIQ